MGCLCSGCETVESPEETINQYIIEDCQFKIKNNKSNVDVEKQLQMKRIEVICVGCWLFNHKNDIDNGTITVIARDSKIEDTEYNYRPDLMFIRNGKLIHVEIDENKHSGYEGRNEQNRHEQIKSYCISKYGSYNLVRFNPDVFTKRDYLTITKKFSDIVDGMEYILSIEHN